MKIVPLNGPGRQQLHAIRWSRDSSELFGTFRPEGKATDDAVEVLTAQHQRIGSGPIPPGFFLTDGWFADSQALYLYLNRLDDEFGAGVIFKCSIAGWKCRQIASNVLHASVGGDGILAMVRAVGKYSHDGEIETYPPAYVAEIRNGASQVVARQTFKSRFRDTIKLSVDPSGRHAILTWFDHSACRKAPEEELCKGGTHQGIIIDLAGKPE
jgi:hypothetical protein